MNTQNNVILNSAIVNSFAVPSTNKIPFSHFIALSEWFTSASGEAALNEISRTAGGFLLSLQDGRKIVLKDELALAMILTRSENLTVKAKNQTLTNILAGKINATGLAMTASTVGTVVVANAANAFNITRLAVESTFSAITKALIDRKSAILDVDFLTELSVKAEKEPTFTTSIDVQNQAAIAVTIDLSAVKTAKLKEFYADKMALLSNEVFVGTATTYKREEISEDGKVSMQLFDFDKANLTIFTDRLEKHFTEVKLTQSKALEAFNCAELTFKIAVVKNETTV